MLLLVRLVVVDMSARRVRSTKIPVLAICVAPKVVCCVHPSFGKTRAGAVWAVARQGREWSAWRGSAGYALDTLLPCPPTMPTGGACPVPCKMPLRAGASGLAAAAAGRHAHGVRRLPRSRARRLSRRCRDTALHGCQSTARCHARPRTARCTSPAARLATALRRMAARRRTAYVTRRPRHRPAGAGAPRRTRPRLGPWPSRVDARPRNARARGTLGYLVLQAPGAPQAPGRAADEARSWGPAGAASGRGPLKLDAPG